MIAPAKLKKETSAEKMEEVTENLKSALGLLETYFLSGEDPFICGQEISIADILCLGEVTQYWMTGDKLEDGYPKLKAWVERCQQYLGDVFERVYEPIYKVTKDGVFKYNFNL